MSGVHRVTLASLAALCLGLMVSSAGAQERRATDDTLRAQVLLDRVRMSPGPIDGRPGMNMTKAVRAFQRSQGLEETGELSPEVWRRLDSDREQPTLVDYEITRQDVKGPFQKRIPEKLEAKARLKRLAYTSPKELLAEKFHMHTELLERLNRGKSFGKAGTIIRVTNVSRPEPKKAARIEVDKDFNGVWILNRDEKIIAFFPASIGSEETPSPSGELKITRIVRNPTYTYDPKRLDFKGVKSRKKFSIRAGPNNPVGLVWIALNEEGYGLHGSPEPERISRQQSHGCVRMTNWDALDLVQFVTKGVPVAFTGKGDNGEPKQQAGSGR